MLKNIALGIYYPGNSLLHRLQSRTKLLALSWIAVWLMMALQRTWHFTPYIVVILLVSINVVLAGISWHEMWRRMWLLLVATAIGSVFTPFMAVRDTRTLYTLSPLIISYGFVQGALLICAGLLMMLLLSSVLPITALQAMWRRNWPRRMKGLLVVVTIATFIALWLVGHPAPDQPYIIGPWRITYGGTWLVVSISTGLLSLYALSLLLTMTTTPVALIEGLSMLLSPLRRLKLPVDDFALMTLLALRFIPTLIEEAEHLIQAQMARGADMTSGTFRERLQSLTILLVPLLRGVLRRAAELATALEARGYEVTGQQTQLHESSLHTIDYIVLVTVILVTVGALLL